jgi:voltage-gated potassium channel
LLAAGPHMNGPAPSPDQKGFLPWLARRAGRRSLTAKRAIVVIIGTTILVTVVGGITIRLLDHKDFDTVGEGMWWAVQTVTTVGYGDLVPHGTAGRLIAAVVMLTGIAFISLVTASVTALLVEQARQQQEVPADPVEAKLDRIGARLEAIEARLEGREPPS